MRTTLDIDRDLLLEAKELGGYPSFNAAIRAALQFVVEEERRRKDKASSASSAGAPRTLIRDRQT